MGWKCSLVRYKVPLREPYLVGLAGSDMIQIGVLFAYLAICGTVFSIFPIATGAMAQDTTEWCGPMVIRLLPVGVLGSIACSHPPSLELKQVHTMAPPHLLELQDAQIIPVPCGEAVSVRPRLEHCSFPNWVEPSVQCSARDGTQIANGTCGESSHVGNEVGNYTVQVLPSFHLLEGIAFPSQPPTSQLATGDLLQLPVATV